MSASAQASDDLLDQFVHPSSGPFAFWRELIQKSIDAGSSRIEVALRHTPGASGKSGVALAQVADWGEGMSRQIIEKFPLIRFRSSKQSDLTGFGKSGAFARCYVVAPSALTAESRGRP